MHVKICKQWEREQVWHVYVALSKYWLPFIPSPPAVSPSQLLQAVGGAHVLLHPHVRALVPVGGVPVGGLLRPGAAQVHAGAERHVAREQRRPHVGEPALWQEHQPPGKQVCHVQRYRYGQHIESGISLGKQTR